MAYRSRRAPTRSRRYGFASTPRKRAPARRRATSARRGRTSNVMRLVIETAAPSTVSRGINPVPASLAPKTKRAKL